MPLFNWPYTNLHSLNLDWIIKTVLKLEKVYDTLPESLQRFVNQWLDDHPEATTTVQDGSLTEAKFTDALKLKTIKEYVTPEMFGAIGDGVNDDTEALQNAFNTGKYVFCDSNKTYLSGKLTIIHDLIINLNGSKLLLKTGTSGVFIESDNGNNLIIFNGTISGNQNNIARNDNILLSITVPHDIKVIIENVRLDYINKRGIYVKDFGGELYINNCQIFNQVCSSNTVDSFLVYILNGEQGYRPKLTYTNNYAKCDVPSGNYTSGAGGVFCNNKYSGNIGNLGEAVFRNNTFVNYGFSNGREFVSPIHFYPEWENITIDGNTFINSAFCAITVKCSENVTITNNKIIGGQMLASNIDTDGAITIALGYFAAADKTKCVCSGNIIKNTGGTGSTLQPAISIHGTSEQIAAAEIIAAENIIENCGIGILCDYAKNISILNNRVIPAKGYQAINIRHPSGLAVICGNYLESDSAMTIAINNVTYNDCIAQVLQNYIVSKDSDNVGSVYPFRIRSVKKVFVSNNTIESAHSGGIVDQYGSVGKTEYFYQNSNAFDCAENEYIETNWNNINRVDGFVISNNVPSGATPYKSGVLYYSTTSNKLYIATGNTSADWIIVGSQS